MLCVQAELAIPETKSPLARTHQCHLVHPPDFFHDTGNKYEVIGRGEVGGPSLLIASALWQALLQSDVCGGICAPRPLSCHFLRTGPITSSIRMLHTRGLSGLPCLRPPQLGTCSPASSSNLALEAHAEFRHGLCRCIPTLLFTMARKRNKDLAAADARVCLRRPPAPAPSPTQGGMRIRAWSTPATSASPTRAVAS